MRHRTPEQIERDREYSKAYYHKNKERMLEMRRKYVSTERGKEVIRRYGKSEKVKLKAKLRYAALKLDPVAFAKFRQKQKEYYQKISSDEDYREKRRKQCTEYHNNVVKPKLIERKNQLKKMTVDELLEEVGFVAGDYVEDTNHER